MGLLAGPFELLELGDGGSLTTTVDKVEEGELTIHPRDGRPPKTIPVIRLHVPHEVKPIFPGWWDLTAATLVAQVRPLLPQLVGTGRQLRITKFGVQPKARFSVEVV